MDRSDQILLKLAPMLYVLNKIGDTNRHKLFKILYFADQDHLSRLGKTITGNTYIAMDAGPVPSELYNFVKVVSKQDHAITDKVLIDALPHYLSTYSHYVKAEKTVSLDFLSEAEIECLDRSISKYKDKSYAYLYEVSHGEAWTNSPRNRTIAVLKIAKEAGSNSEMLKFIDQGK